MDGERNGGSGPAAECDGDQPEREEIDEHVQSARTDAGKGWHLTSLHRRGNGVLFLDADAELRNRETSAAPNGLSREPRLHCGQLNEHCQAFTIPTDTQNSMHGARNDPRCSRLNAISTCCVQVTEPVRTD